MERRTLLTKLGLTALAGTIFHSGLKASVTADEKCSLLKGEIQHMVIFNLKHAKGSPEALKFIERDNQPRYESMQWYCDIIGIDFEAAIKAINKAPKLYP